MKTGNIHLSGFASCLLLIIPLVSYFLAHPVEGREVVRGLRSSQVVTGIIHAPGEIITAEGERYKLIGDKAGEICEQVGEKVQVKGTLLHRDDGIAIKVENYKLLKEPLLEKPVR
jgi:hypothetical protein